MNEQSFCNIQDNIKQCTKYVIEIPVGDERDDRTKKCEEIMT